MKKLIVAAAVAFALCGPAAAQAPSTTAPSTAPATVMLCNAGNVGTPGCPSPVAIGGPVGSPTYLSVGTLAGQVLTWAAAAFGTALATVFTAWGVRLFKLAGVQISDAARARLQEIIVNGLNVGAKEVEKDLAGKDPVMIKNAVVAQAVAYAQAHGADTIKALGLDPQSGEAVEAIKARIQTAIADPAAPTPAVLDPAPAAPKPAA